MAPATDPTVQEIVGGIARWAADSAATSVNSLLVSFGAKTEPDFSALLPSYNRMLAIAMLLAGTFIAAALIEQMLGGNLGAGWSVIPRTAVAVFFAFAGLTLVGYASEHVVLLSDAWSSGFAANTQLLQESSQTFTSADPSQLPMGGVGGLILTSLLTMLLSLLVYLELILRAGLLVVLTTFVPLVCVMGIWPRLAGAAAHLGEFLFAVLLSKFVMATAIFVGYSFVVQGLHADGSSAHVNLLVTGLAVLTVTAFAPLVLVQGLRFGHATSASLVRSWGARGTSVMVGASVSKAALTPIRGLASRVGSNAARVINPVRQKVVTGISHAGEHVASSSWFNRLRRGSG